VVSTSLKCIVMVDNLPVVPESKLERLKKHVTSSPAMLAKWGSKPVKVDMPLANGKTKGFAFMEFENPKFAELAAKGANNHKLDKAHTLATTLMNDFQRIVDTKSQYVEPEMEEFKPKENLNNWLMDEAARDQFVIRFQEKTQIYWNDAKRGPIQLIEKDRWSDSYINWSPKGRYLTTYHHQGILLWGGESWGKQMKLQHQRVMDILFSPNETYVITWSYQKGAMIWDLRNGGDNGVLRRHFPDMCERNKYAKFTWSHDEKYVARITKLKNGQDCISVFSLPSMAMVPDKNGNKNQGTILCPGVEDLQWSPSDNILTYWQPETEANPARVIVMQFTVPEKEPHIPQMKVIAQKNLFMVVSCQIFWQPTGDYLCVKVERTNKTKKAKFFNFELFRMREHGKDGIPTEVIKKDVPIVSFSWEPVGHRFGVVYGESSRPDIDIFTMQGKDSQGKNQVEQVGATLAKKSANMLIWAPQGQFCVLAGLQTSNTAALNGTLEFWDMNSMEAMGMSDHLMCTGISWDPTGRYVCSEVSMLDQRTPGGMGHGFNVYTLDGVQLYSMELEQFTRFLWRPRPKSPLDEQEKKKIKKNLHEIGREFDRVDAEADDEMDEEQKQKIAKARAEWSTITDEWTLRRSQEKAKRTAAQGYDSDEDEGQPEYETTYEMVEEVISVTTTEE